MESTENRITPEDGKLLEKQSYVANPGSRESVRIYKNVFVLSVVFMFHFSSYNGTEFLQSSIHKDIGTYSLIGVYISCLFGNLFISVLAIRVFGMKTSMIFGIVSYMPYVAAQYYPRAFTLIPSAVLLGLGASILWCAQGSYLAVLADALGIIQQREKVVKAGDLLLKLFSIFHLFQQSSGIWGNLISSSVLSPKDSEVQLSNITASVGEVCGANYCPANTHELSVNFVKPPEEKIMMMVSIYLGLMGVATLLIIFFLDSEKRYGSAQLESKIRGWKLLTHTSKQLTNKYQLLLIPLTFFTGLDNAILSADFTKAFVACGWGISFIGYAMTCMGVANALGSAFTGMISKAFGRLPLIIGNVVVQICLIVFLLKWRPEANGVYYCLIAAVWGFINGIWLVQMKGLSSVFFPGNEDAYFSCFALIRAIGFVVGFAISPVTCMYLKLWAMVVLLCTVLVSYPTMEILYRKTKENMKSENTLLR